MYRFFDFLSYVVFIKIKIFDDDYIAIDVVEYTFKFSELGSCNIRAYDHYLRLHAEIVFYGFFYVLGRYDITVLLYTSVVLEEPVGVLAGFAKK